MTVTRDPAPDVVATSGRRPNWLLVGLGSAAFVVIALIVTALRPAPRFPFVKGPTGMAQEPTTVTAPYLLDNHIGCTIVMSLIGIVGVVIGVRMSLRGRTWLPIMVALSAILIVFPEVFFDVMGAVWYPYSETEPLGSTFTILGRTMPVWILAGWFGYGVFSVVTFAMLNSRPSTRNLWYAWGLTLAGDVVFEEILLQFDVYHYYGNQPLVILTELPWWWIPCNSVGVMLAAALAYRFRNSLRGWKSIVVFATTPMSVAAVYGFIALPSWIATNADFPWLVTQLIGFATLVLGVFAFLGVLKFVLNRDPFDLDYKPEEADEFVRVN
jgi:hypothetical protein